MKWVERIREFPPFKRFHVFGMVGSIVVLACVLVPMFAYAGSAGERFSPLNHFISELGERGVSRLSPVFNIGLVAAGALYLPFVLGLGAAVGGWWAAAGTLAGLVSAVSVACVGVFPMNNLAPHIVSAMLFFRSGLVTVLLFGIAIQRQLPDRRAIDRRANVAGIAALLAFAGFIVWIELQPGGSAGFQASAFAHRPAVWVSAILEWSVLAAIIAWFFVVGASRRALTAPSATCRRRSSPSPARRGSRADSQRTDRLRAP
ncbi:MAG: hypothetical protein A2177_16795 [Spirochaetes bacterium RBG_13_68_11]|nr:MAG: hypothetical protein A2177_16795 [Spirochaetes bacterium RBG_13_68_11]